jgi:hypothetical protein|tara:strand:- start:679 stop:927 length:249 start_codon:yes stop_codon:yes gene_type:complete
MSNFFQNADAATTERISAQRDDIYEGVVSQFRNLMANEQIDDALALADEFFEWMDPNQLEDEETIYFNENELKALYSEITEA